ncbi:hypothetical protein nbrc107696_08350 [Gordonia spumicola]|uniref:Uncharacterized protein n=1 Tax=Gordonia spumicola TaxID=589161 RepID=A0A7I9V4P1_9ACTN|nr:hypothetical protein [Gordonia spumicola]GEE00389.1 hypothetical protein nbrc107696_08350 [Gordonia spumicola]
MARDKGRGIISARTVGMVFVAIVFIAIGVVIGIELGGTKADDQRQQIESCLPIASAAQLAYCLDGDE